jgi:hypothetical protein
MINDNLMAQAVADWSNLKKQVYWFWLQDFLVEVEDMIFSRRSPTRGQDAREPWENEFLPILEWIIRWQENMTLFSRHCKHMQSLADLGDILSENE